MIILDKSLNLNIVSDIIKETNKPMSIEGIVARFNPSIPFQVKCVRNILPDPNSTPYNVNHRGTPVGEVITIIEPPNLFGYWRSSYSIDGRIMNIHPLLEKWVLQ